jgi:serine/threonine protein kinase
MVSALYELHVKKNMAHRDIKPENFMLDKENSLVMVDFGLAKRFEGYDDVLRGSGGTTRFFPPEMVRVG